MNKLLSIGQASKALGVTIQTLRNKEESAGSLTLGRHPLMTLPSTSLH